LGNHIAPGSIVGGKYRLEQPLSRGGMGSVWVAQHLALGTPVAVKLMDPTYARWRRQVVVPEIKKCQNNSIPTELTRLPRNKQEGDIPKIEIASSTYDSEECILRKIGIDEWLLEAMKHRFPPPAVWFPGRSDRRAVW